MIYRVFYLDMIYFEVPDGQLKLTFKFKRRWQHVKEVWIFEFYQSIFKKVTLVGTMASDRKGVKIQPDSLPTILFFKTSK